MSELYYDLKMNQEELENDVLSMVTEQMKWSQVVIDEKLMLGVAV